MPSLLDSSRISLIPITVSLLTNPAICSSNADFLTWYGIALITIDEPLSSSTTSQSALTWNFPFPVLYMSSMPSIPKILAPVGKSGPLMCSMYSAISINGVPSSRTFPSSIVCTWKFIAEDTSFKLCGGILVAIPTAIPSLPFNNRFGSLDGRTLGSCSVSSKFGWKSTVFFLISSNICLEILSNLDSVYLIAAGGSPSIEPKLPCPSINGYLSEKS